MRAEKTFLSNKTIWYAFYSKYATFIDFEKILFYFKKLIYFSKKNSQILNV